MNLRSDGRWQERLYIPDLMSKAKYFYSSEKSERKAKNDIQKQMAEYQFKIQEEKHNFKRLYERAIEEKSRFAEHNTIEMYKYAFKRVPTYIYNKCIEDIQPSEVQFILNELAKRYYSYSAIHQVKVLFGVVFDYAIINGLPVKNFVKSIQIPKIIKKNKIHSPDNEVIEFIKSNVEKPFGLWALFLLCTGARQGEANAVRKSDIDLTNDIIHINHSTEFIGNNPHIKDTKTESGKRDVPILELIKPYLKAKIKGLKKDDYLFGGNAPMSKTAIRYNFEKYKKDCDFNFTQHQLRHAYAKLLYMAGIDPKTAQGLLGHSSIAVTMDIYTDFSKELNKISANKINELLCR